MSRTTVFTALLMVGLLQACSDSTDTSATSESASVAGATPASAPASEAQLSVADVASPSVDASASTYQDLQGNPLELSTYAGKKVFLNYWATWCAPCIREIPSIARAAGILEEENFVFLLASDESVETITDFLADREFEGNFIKLNGFFGSHGIDAVPSSVLFDETGARVKSWPGAFEWDSEEMLAELRGARAQ